MSNPRRPRIIIAGVLAVAAIGVAVYLTVFADGASAPNSATKPTANTPSTTTATSPPKTVTVASLPPSASARPDALTGAVRLLAKSIPADTPAAILAAIQKATAERILRPRTVPGNARMAPRTASDLATSITSKRAVDVGSFETTSLLHALLVAKDIASTQDITWGVDPSADGSASELMAQRYVLSLDGGKTWLASDPAPVPAGIVTLNEASYFAHLAAWRAYGALSDGDADTAARFISYARGLDAASPVMLFTEGKVLVSRGQTDIGVAAMERAVEQRADWLSHYLLGRMATLEGKAFVADQAFKKAAELKPTSGRPYHALADLAIEQLELTPAADHPRLVARARAHIKEARTREPTLPGVRVSEAHLLALDEKHKEAEAMLRDEVAQFPGELQGSLVLAQYLTVQQRDAEALEVLETAKQNGVEDPELLESLGALLAATGRFDEARKPLERALELDPNSPSLRPQLAQLYRDAGKIDRATRVLTEHTKRFDDDLTGKLLLAQILLDEEQFDDGLAQVAKVLKLKPDNKDAVLLDYLGRLMGKRDAESARTRAIKVVGKRSAVAQVLLEQGQPEASESLLTEALDKEPEDVVAPVLLIALYTATDRPEDAMKLHKRTLAATPEDQRADVEQMIGYAVSQATEARERIAPTKPEAPEAPATP